MNYMRVLSRDIGVFCPIYRLAGEGLSDSDVAKRLNLTEPIVHESVRRVLDLLEFRDRNQLVEYYSNASPAQALLKGALLERLDNIQD
jgi:hypothetical protein